nr:protein FAR1-RELATED SEQUENCE 5-like [Ipomoea batatas]
MLSLRITLPARCESSMTSYISQGFDTVESGELFCFEYVVMAGFDVCRSTVKKDRMGNTFVRYFVCSRQGFKQVVCDQSVKWGGGNDEAAGGSRRRASNMFSCSAWVVLKRANTEGGSPPRGVTFLITPSKDPPPWNSYGEYLGLTNATTDGNSRNQTAMEMVVL